MKMLYTNSKFDCVHQSFSRSSFETEASILSAISDPNIAGVVGACLHTEPRFMVCEFSELGDLNQYLQDHVAETSLSHSSAVNTLR